MCIFLLLMLCYGYALGIKCMFQIGQVTYQMQQYIHCRLYNLHASTFACLCIYKTEILLHLLPVVSISHFFATEEFSKLHI